MSKNSLIFILGLIPILFILLLIFIVIGNPRSSITDNTNDFDMVSYSDPFKLIDSYFKLINEGDITSAIDLHGPELGSSTDQFLLDYANLKSIELISVDKINEGENMVQYMVIFNIELMDGSDPKYIEGENMRFFTLKKEGGNYIIMDISTGP